MITKEFIQVNCNTQDCIHFKTCCKASTVIIRSNNLDKIDLFIVGMGCGSQEDIFLNPKNTNREPFFGRSGSYMRSIIKYFWDKNILFNIVMSNTVRCHPTDTKGKDRAPTVEETNFCKQYLFNDTVSIKPNCVLTVGHSSTVTLFPDYTDLTIGQLRSVVRNYNFLNSFDTKTVATYHPSYLLRQYGKFDISQKNMFDLRFINDLSLALGRKL